MSFWPESFKNFEILDKAAIKYLAYGLGLGKFNANQILNITKNYICDVSRESEYHRDNLINLRGDRFFSEQYIEKFNHNYFDLFKRVVCQVINLGRTSDFNLLSKGICSVMSFYHAAYWFSETRTNPTVEGKLVSFNKLSPSQINFENTFNASIEQLIFLGLVIKSEAEQTIKTSGDIKLEKLLNSHVAGFGTGGDGVHTINMTTLCMPIAALYYQKIGKPDGEINFIKLSTKAVTGEIGGADVAQAFLSGFKKPDNFEIITLGELGFPYSRELVEARKLFAKQEIELGDLIDPYKVCYPPVNLSNANYIATGSHPKLQETAVRIASSINFLEIWGEQINNSTYSVAREDMIHQVFFSSSLGNDELMFGLNNIDTSIFRFDDRLSLKTNIQFNFRKEELAKASLFLREQPTIDMQARRMHEILGVEKPRGAIPKAANRIVAANAAMFLPEVIRNNFQSEISCKLTELVDHHAKAIQEMLEDMQRDKLNNPLILRDKLRI